MKARLQATWQDWEARFGALSQRERIMVAAATLGSILYLGSILWVGPMFDRARNYGRQSLAQSAELSSLQTQIVVLGQQVASDPNAPLRLELDNINRQVAEVEARLQQFDQSLVAPTHTATLLNGLIRKAPGVRLVGFKNLAAAGLLASRLPAPKPGAPADAAKMPQALDNDVYKHGFELKLRGNYLALLTYLKILESQPEHLLWQRAQLQVTAYPEAELTLTVYTLSMDRHWLEL